MANANVSSFLGGSPTGVLMRLLVVSFIVGMVLVTFGFDPESIYESFARLVRRIIEYGFGDLRQIGRVLLTGAVVVVPVWFVMRLLDQRRAR